MIPEVAKGQFQLSHLLQSNFLSSYHSPPTHLKYNTKYFNQTKNPIFCWCTNNALSLNTGIGKTMTNGFCGMCQQWDYLSQSWLSSDVKCVFQSPTMPFLSICKWWAIHNNTFFISKNNLPHEAGKPLCVLPLFVHLWFAISRIDKQYYVWYQFCFPRGRQICPTCHVYLCKYMLKQEQIVLERSARLNLDPGRGD